MTYRSMLVTVTLGLAACGPKHAGSSSDDACGKAARNAYPSGGGKAAAGSRESELTTDAIADACRKDQWSAALIDCIATTPDLKSDGERCEAMLKVAKYTVNNKKREGTLIIGFQ